MESRSPTRRRTSSKRFATPTSSSKPKSNKSFSAQDRETEGSGSAQAGGFPSFCVDLDKLQKLLGYTFKKSSLLETALTHRSLVNETSIDSGRVQNERLEFLGDAVLGLAVAHMLYEHSPDMAEGDLARIKSVVVSEATLATIASHLKIPSFIKLGRGEELSGGRNKPAIIADAMEALIGAIFLDSGYEAAMRAVEGFLSQSIREAIISGGKDHKTLLQEYCQKHFRRVPEYVLVKSEGPEHRRVFWVSCQIGEKSYGPFSGTTKKDAEMNAARSAYKALISPITTRT